MSLLSQNTRYHARCEWLIGPIRRLIRPLISPFEVKPKISPGPTLGPLTAKKLELIVKTIWVRINAWVTFTSWYLYTLFLGTMSFSFLGSMSFLGTMSVLGTMSILGTLSVLGTLSWSHGLARPSWMPRMIWPLNLFFAQCRPAVSSSCNVVFLQTCIVVLRSMSWGQLFLLLVSTGPFLLRTMSSAGGSSYFIIGLQAVVSSHFVVGSQAVGFRWPACMFLGFFPSTLQKFAGVDFVFLTSAPQIGAPFSSSSHCCSKVGISSSQKGRFCLLPRGERGDRLVQTLYWLDQNQGTIMIEQWPIWQSPAVVRSFLLSHLCYLTGLLPLTNIILAAIGISFVLLLFGSWTYLGCHWHLLVIAIHAF